MKTFKIFALCWIALLGQNLCAEAVKPAVENALEFSAPESVKLDGILGGALDAALRGDVLTSDIDMLIAPFRTRPETRRWDCEFWGKWFTGALLAYDYTPSFYFKKRLDKNIAELLATQDAEGSITTYQKAHEFKLNPKGWLTEGDKNSWDLWGRKYTLLGLLDYYSRTGDAKVLEAAKRHTDYIMDHVGRGKKDIVQVGCWFGCASTSILEPIVLLYRATGEKKYLDYAYWIVESWETSPIKPDLLNKALKNMEVFDMFEHPDPKYQGYLGGGKSKAYEMGSCFEGLAELYRTTGDEKFKTAVLNHARSIRDTEINVVGSGSIQERWINGKFVQTNGDAHWNEVCVTATWIKLCGQLLRLTADPQYADHIELSMYNGLLGQITENGEWWAGTTPLDGVRKFSPDTYCTKKTCCTTNGIRSLFLAPKIAYMAARDGAAVNFYEKSSARLCFGGKHADIVCSGADFIYNDTANFEISGIDGGAAKFAIYFRIPRWCEFAEISVNGGEKIFPKSGEYCKIEREWKDGDTVAVSLRSGISVVKDPAGSDFICLSKAMYTLAQDKRFEPDFAKPARLKLENGKPIWKPARLKDARVAVDVLLENGKWRRFVDYGSAGKTFSADSEIRTWFKQNAECAKPALHSLRPAQCCGHKAGNVACGKRGFAKLRRGAFSR